MWLNWSFKSCALCMHYINSTGFLAAQICSFLLAWCLLFHSIWPRPCPSGKLMTKIDECTSLLDGTDVRTTPDKLFSCLMPVFQGTSLAFISCFSNRWCTAVSSKCAPLPLTIPPPHTWPTLDNQWVLSWHCLAPNRTPVFLSLFVWCSGRRIRAQLCRREDAV